LSLPGKFLPNWEKEAAEDLRRIRVYSGALHGCWPTLRRDAILEGPDYLGGIPFGKMDALEAVAVSEVGSHKGSFSSLLLRPSLKLLQMKFSAYDTVRVAEKIAKDVAGSRADQVETLVLLSWWTKDFPGGLEKMLALFPNLKSLRISVDLFSGDVGLELGRLVGRELPHLSELAVDGINPRRPRAPEGLVASTFSGLGNGWTRARGCPDTRARVVAEGRACAQFSSYFFDDEFFDYCEDYF
jgi:hypothetical protein